MASEATKTEAFTPGPWEVRKDPSHFHTASSVYECGVDFPSVAEVGGSTVVMQEANARLIAAAPDLYAACKDVVNCYANLSDDALAQAVSMCRAALTKATGGAA